jgi:tRNA (guanine37-N1)-methyltransferase
MSGAPALSIHVLTLFPEIFESPLRASLLGKAIEAGIVEVCLHDIRDHATDKHRTVDDTPYGGGAGMVMRADVVVAAMEAVEEAAGATPRRIMLSPGGRPMRQQDLRRWAELGSLTIVCGRYEGIDARVSEHFVDEDVSLGDFVLGGGEVPALALIEGVARLVPGVVGNKESLEGESFERNLLAPPQYTRPRGFRDHEVPDMLLSGNHAQIDAWRKERSLEKTRRIRPDLLKAQANEEIEPQGS